MGALCAWAWRALREWAHYACVMGVRGDRGKRPQKRGCAAYGEISPKKKSVNEKKEIKKSFKIFAFSC